MLSIPKVSLLMTVYNREKYIRQAIESILKSKFTDYELILTDDGSTDASPTIIEKYAARDGRIKFYRNEKNLGDYHNRNKAASLANGEYLKYVDADDLVYPHGVGTMVEMMDRFPESGYGLASLEQDKYRLFPFQLNPKEAYKRHYFEQPLFHKAPLSAIIRRDVFEKEGGFTGKRYVGDFEFWHILSRKYPVVLMPQGVVWYREHEEQEMQHNRTDHSIPFRYLECSEEMLMHPDCPLSDSDSSKALRKIKWNQSRYILGVGKNHSLRTMKILKDQAGYSYFNLFKNIIKTPAL